MNASSTLQAGKSDYFEEERTRLRHQFLKAHGLEREPLAPLPGDASKRRYFRLPKGLLMDAPPPEEKTEDFQRIAEILAQTGLTVPRIYAVDHRGGFMWVEDLGILTYRKALEEGISEELLYGETIKSLAHLHRKMPENMHNLSPYSLDLFLEKACLFIEWADVSVTASAKVTFKELWREAYLNQPQIPHSLLLRDVMVDNLIWLPNRDGFKKSGFIDFQDALWGPICYDLVSLLEDARRDISPEFAGKMVDLYFTENPDVSRDDFWASYYVWGAQRTTRILGLFYRLAKRDGKTQYLSHLPRLWKILKQDLGHPHLKDLKNWFKEVLP